MRRTAAGSALVCAGFALGATGATLAGPTLPRTAIAFLRGNESPYVAVAAHNRPVPAAPVSRNRPVAAAARTHAATPRATARVQAATPANTVEVRKTSQVNPAPTPPLSLDVALDPARTLDAAAVGLCRILTALPTAVAGAH